MPTSRALVELAGSALIDSSWADSAKSSPQKLQKAANGQLPNQPEEPVSPQTLQQPTKAPPKSPSKSPSKLASKSDQNKTNLWKIDKAAKIGQIDDNKLRRWFNEIDVDHSGLLDRKELSDAMRGLGKTDEEIDHAVSSLLSSASDAIHPSDQFSFEQFKSVMQGQKRRLLSTHCLVM